MKSFKLKKYLFQGREAKKEFERLGASVVSVALGHPVLRDIRNIVFLEARIEALKESSLKP